MHVSVSHVTPLPRDRLFEWWTDYQPEDHSTGPFAKVLVGGEDRREILQDTPERVSFVERGRWLGLDWTEHVEAHPHPPDRVDFRSESRFGTFTGSFYFEEMPGGTGTRVTYLLRIPEGAGVGRVPGPLLAPAARWAMGLDLAWHLREAERELVGDSAA